MHWLRHSAKTHRLLALLQLTAFLPACSTWQVQQASPAEVVTTGRPRAVRVSSTSNSRLELRYPEVQGDTLYGLRWSRRDEAWSQRTGIPLTEVKDVALLRTDYSRTAVLMLGLAGVTVVALCVFADQLGCERPDFLAD